MINKNIMKVCFKTIQVKNIYQEPIKWFSGDFKTFEEFDIFLKVNKVCVATLTQEEKDNVDNTLYTIASRLLDQAYDVKDIIATNKYIKKYIKL